MKLLGLGQSFRQNQTALTQVFKSRVGFASGKTKLHLHIVSIVVFLGAYSCF